MSKSFSKFISLLLHPLIMPLYMALLIIYVHPNQFPDYGVAINEYGIFNRDIKLMFFFALMTIFPVFAIFLMKKLELISSYNPEDKRERFIPLIATGTFWLWTFIMFKEGAEYPTASFAPLGLMILGCVSSLFIYFPLNFAIKINIPIIGAAALISMLLNIIPTSQFNLTFILILAILICGALASAQLSLGNTHKNDLLTGFLIGFFGQFFAFNIWAHFM